jgi:phosphatidylinositol alpha-1,6-mannosyltransferase
MSKPVMLALVTDAFGGRGGIAQYNRDFLGALSDLGAIREIVVIPRQAPEPAQPPEAVTQLSPPRGKLTYAFRTLFQTIRRRPAVVFCGHLNLAVLARIAARMCGARLIVQTHGIEAWKRPSRPRRAVVEAADLVLCVSRYTRARVLDWAATAPERVAVLPNTVADIFEPGGAGPLRLELGLEKRRVLLTVGRLDARERYKGHDDVIKAIPQLVSQGHDIAYIIVGEGDDRGRLEALTKAQGVAERMRFLGTVPLQTLIAAYRTADLFVMPSCGEGFGIAFLEALACGTPALGLAIGGASDALADGDLGRMAADVDNLADVIADLLSTPLAPTQGILSSSVRARFGLAVFRERVNLVLGRLAVSA